VLTVSAADLYVVFVGDGLELLRLLSELGQLDVHGGAHTSAEVSGARGDVAKMLVIGELSLLLNLSSSDGEALEHLADVGALLHRDDTELVLLVDPDEEGLGIVVEDTASLGPLTLETAGFQVLVSTFK